MNSARPTKSSVVQENTPTRLPHTHFLTRRLSVAQKKNQMYVVHFNKPIITKNKSKNPDLCGQMILKSESAVEENEEKLWACEVPG